MEHRHPRVNITSPIVSKATIVETQRQPGRIVVTKRGGLITSSSIQTAFSEPWCVHLILIYHAHTSLRSSQHSNPITDSFFHTLQIKNRYKQQQTKLDSIHFQSHSFSQIPSEETLSSAFQIMYIPDSTSIASQQVFTKHQIRCSSISQSLSLHLLYNCSTAVRLIARRSGRFWHLAEISKTTELSLTMFIRLPF
jgi:hypothetical protein